MDLYYINTDSKMNGKYEVHKLGCDYFPINPTYLGPFYDLQDALVGPFYDLQDALGKARQYYPEAEGCHTCCAPRHRRVFYNPS